MLIDGKAIAENIIIQLTDTVKKLKSAGVTPTLAVILVGDNPASLSYIRQKQKAAERIGATIRVESRESRVESQALQELIKQYNNDPAIHGIIIQRPLPDNLKSESLSLCSSILLSKDVDGFIENSPFAVPVVRAVLEILRFIYFQLDKFDNLNQFESWLKTKRIVVVGRGETAGKPIADYLAKHDCTTSVIYSQTPNPQEIMRNADIIISCVGKKRVVAKNSIKPGSILISVGIWRDSEGKLHGDYEEDDIKDSASFYTPTPGGVGPINVACLIQNLVKASDIMYNL